VVSDISPPFYLPKMRLTYWFGNLCLTLLMTPILCWHIIYISIIYTYEYDASIVLEYHRLDKVFSMNQWLELEHVPLSGS